MQLLCSLSEVQVGSAISISIGGVGYIVVHNEQGVRAFINACPHLGIPLEWQENDFIDQETQLIRCATHGALFLTDSGECVSGPCAGDKLTPVDILVEDDQVYLADG